ncbi:MAG: zinc-binding dehydrogenase [Novosphingobium sp.]|nr:zinc-binding dehydrogenase [Novosphingobium sp.]
MTKQMVSRLMKSGRFEITETDIPDAGEQDVVVEVASCGICGSDLGMVRASAGFDGAVLGHEFSGRVVAIGSKVEGIANGDRVTANPMVNFIGLGRTPGAFAQYVRIPAPVLGRNIFKLPDAIDDEAGALIEPLTVGLHAVNRSGAMAGDKVVIFGTGPIGICVLAALRARGVSDVLTIDPSARRRGFAQEMGAKAVHDPVDGSAVTFISGHFGSAELPYEKEPLAQADIVFDCAGVQAVLDEAVLSLKHGGKLMLVADPHDIVVPARLVMLHELSIIGAVGYEDEFDEAIAMLASGDVDLSFLVTHRFPLSQIDEAFAMQRNAEQAGKVLVEAGN